MPNIQPRLAPVSVAGLALAASSALADSGLPWPSAAEILAATGATKTTAYKVRAAVLKHLPGALRPPGRPPKPPRPQPARDELLMLGRRVQRFVYDHPGCVSGSEARRSYSGGFCSLVLEVCTEHQALSLGELADVTGVPLGTLKDWLRGKRPQVSSRDVASPDGAKPEPGALQLQTVLQAWAGWQGGFLPFCEHVQLHLRIPFGRDMIRNLLAAEGVRIPKRRARRPVDASALRGTFETFFPGAQWVGDGTEVAVNLWGQRFTFNLELLVDPSSGAFPGASLRPTEDSVAVIEAVADGVATTGAPPLAVLLDNKPSNHSAAVDEALGDEILRMRSRPYTPTDKPHIEGIFGLFKQSAPDLSIDAREPTKLAEQILRLVLTTWLRATNHRPWADRGGRSRVELYREHAPTPEEIQRARAAFAERVRKQQRAQQTHAARQDPVVRGALDAAFERLGLDDPDKHLRVAIASWPADAVLAGIAIFQAKHDAGTLPEDVDARYLRGIVKNIAQESEGLAIAEALLRERLAARDRALALLHEQRVALERAIHDTGGHTDRHLLSLIDHALDAPRRIDRSFWLLAAADLINTLEPQDLQPALRLAARRVHASHSLPYRERLAVVRFLYAKALPVV